MAVNGPHITGARRRPRPAPLTVNTSELAGAFDGYRCHASGLRARVARCASTGRAIELHGELLAPDGTHAGRFQRTVDRDSRGRLTLTLAHLRVQPAWQARGFGRGFHRHAADAGRALGVERLLVHATGAGSFAWAALYPFAGVDEDPSGRAAAAAASMLLFTGRRRVEQLVSRGEVTAAAAAAFLAGFATPAEPVGALQGRFNAPAQIAGYGRGDAWVRGGRATWLGRELLLGASWTGAIDLRRAG